MKNPKTLVGGWFLLTALVLAIAIALAGIGRMTESRLTVVDFNVFRGHLPPITPSGWRKQYDEYVKSHPGFWNDTVDNVSGVEKHPMDLGEFEVVWTVEYAHKLLTRFLPIVFFIPAIFFWVRGQFDVEQKRATVMAGSLMIGAGFVSLLMYSIWGMDPYGSTDKMFPRTKHYRLSFFLASGMTTYLTLLSAGISTLMAPQYDYRNDAKVVRLNWFSRFTQLALFATFFFGTLVAGTDAGLIYNDWPMYDGQWLWPNDLFALSPWWRNFVENRAMIQWLHRHSAYFAATCVAVLWFLALRVTLHRRAHLAFHVLLGLAVAQGALGVLNLWFLTPALLAILHQNTNLLLLSATFWVTNELRSYRVSLH